MLSNNTTYARGDRVYIMINPHGFTAKNIFGVIEDICPDSAFGGGDLYMIRYRDPVEKVEWVKPFRSRYLAPNDPGFFIDMAVHHEEIARGLRNLARSHRVQPARFKVL